MANFTRLPARLDLARTAGDDFAIVVTVTDSDGPVDISSWSLDGEGCSVSVSDGPAGQFTVTPSRTDGSGVWRVVRSAPTVRTLLAGTDRVSDQTGPSTDGSLELRLVEDDALQLEVSGGGSGSGGVVVQDDGVGQGTVGTLNFTGASVSVSGGVATVAITAATAAQGSLADTAVQPGDDAATLGSGAATDGHVLTADGAGGAAYEAPPSGTNVPDPAEAADDLVPTTEGGEYVLKALPEGGGTGLTLPSDSTLVLATDSQAVADANPSVSGFPVTWLLLEELPDPGPPPAAPGSFDAVDVSDTRIDLSWAGVSSNPATQGYEVRIDGGSWIDVGNVLAYQATGLDPDTAYDFEVRAYNGEGAGPIAGPVNESTQLLPTVPDAPDNLVATGGDGEVSLMWSPTMGADGHRVYRNTSIDFNTSTQVGADLGPTADEFVDDTVTNDTEYFYWIVAFNGVGESAPSVSDSATPSASGGPLETFTDDFNRADQPLANSPNWVDVTLSADIVSNRVRPAQEDFYHGTLTPASFDYGPDQYVEVEVVSLGSAAGLQLAQALVRVTEGSGVIQNGFGGALVSSGDVRRYIYEDGEASFTVVGSVSFSLPHTLYVEVEGTTGRIYVDNNLIHTYETVGATDGVQGIGIRSAGNVANVELDNFEAGAIA